MSPRERRRLKRILSLEEFEPIAARILPHATMAYVGGSAGSGAAYRNNRERLDDWRFVTRVLRNTEGRTQTTTLFGQRYAAPFGIAPMGASAVIAYDADNRLARAAGAADVPYILSANAITPLEEVIRANPRAWFAAYLPIEQRVIEGMVDRVGRAGFPLFMVTVDVPVASNRPGEKHAGYTMPLRPGPRLIDDVVSHPGWLFKTFARTVAARGIPAIANVQPTGRGPSIFSRTIGGVFGHSAFDWGHIDLIRRRWPGPLVVKGLLSPEDAHIAAEHGVDGIVVSNHGGRQLDYAAASIEMLAAVKQRSADMTVLVDSGFRRGTDVLKAIALGADAVLLGRPFLYAATVGGQPGVARAIELLRRELDTDLALLGLRSPAEIRPDMLVRQEPAHEPALTA